MKFYLWFTNLSSNIKIIRGRDSWECAAQTDSSFLTLTSTYFPSFTAIFEFSITDLLSIFVTETTTLLTLGFTPEALGNSAYIR